MTDRGVGRALALALLLGGSGCSAAGTVNAPALTASSAESTSTAPAPTPAPTVLTETVTQTVVVVSTVTVTISPSATDSSASASSAGTSSASSSTSSSAPTPTAAPEPHATPTTGPGALSPAAASDVVLAFLGALEKDPSGASSVQYLSQRLQAQLQQSGKPVVSLLGVQNMYSAYRADAAISRGGGRAATVRATLTYGAGPVQRLFTLVPEGGAWKIEDIADTNA